MDSVQLTQKELKNSYDIDAKPWLIHNIMKKDLKMRYRKVRPIPLGTNSD